MNKSRRTSFYGAATVAGLMITALVATTELEKFILPPRTTRTLLFCKGFSTTSLSTLFSSPTTTSSRHFIDIRQQQQRQQHNDGASKDLLVLFSMSPRGDGGNNRNNIRPTGVYSRPSAAIEKGSGFYVPGLEGSRVRALFGVLVLILGYWNHISGGVTKAMTSSSASSAAVKSGLADIALAQMTSEIITVVLGSFLIVQGCIEAAKESGKIVVLTDPYQQQQQKQQYRQDQYQRQQQQQQQQQSFYNDPNEFTYNQQPPGTSRRDYDNNEGGIGGFFNRITGNRGDGEFLLSDQDLYVSDKSNDIYRQFDNTESDMRYSDDRFFQQGNRNNNNNNKGLFGGIFNNNNNNNNNGQYRPNRKQNYDDRNRQRQSGLNDMDQTSFDSSQSFRQPNNDNYYYNNGNDNPIVTSARLASNDRRPRDMGDNRKFINNVGGTNSGMILSQNSNKGYYSQQRGGAMASKVGGVRSGNNFTSSSNNSSITNFGRGGGRSGVGANTIVNTDLGLDVMASTNLTYEQRECARWIGASIISMTPATHVLLVDYDGYGGPEILFSLGNFGNTFNDPNTANYIMSAVTTVQNSTGGRVSVPSTHRSAKLLPEFARRSVVLQRLPTFEPPGTQCLIVGSNQVLQAYASNDLAWFGSLVTYFSSI